MECYRIMRLSPLYSSTVAYIKPIDMLQLILLTAILPKQLQPSVRQLPEFKLHVLQQGILDFINLSATKYGINY